VIPSRFGTPRLRSLLHSFLALLPILAAAGEIRGEEAIGLGSYEIHGEWRVFRGPWHRGGHWRFRFLDESRASLRIEFPTLANLPRALHLAKDGGAVLHWTDPASAEALLGDDDPLLETLRELPAAAWAALLLGRGLETQLQVAEECEGARGRILTGSLGGRPVRLEATAAASKTLRWEENGGLRELRWRIHSAARRLVLDLREDDKLLLRMRMRPERHRPLSPEDWLFLDP